MPKLKKLYHGTTPEAWASIEKDGIKPMGIEGVIYLSVDRTDCARFIIDSKDCKIERDENGQMKIEPRTHLYVIEIDAMQINKKLLKQGIDHNPEIYKHAVFTYPDVIPTEAFSDIWKLDLQKLQR